MVQNAPSPESQQPTDAAAPAQTEVAAADPRLERIAEQLAEALRNPDLLRGIAMASACDLMKLAWQLNKAIDQELANGPGSLDDFAELSPALDTFLRMMKQIERFSQLDMRLAAAHRTADPVRANPPRSTRPKPTPPPLSEFFGL